MEHPELNLENTENINDLDFMNQEEPKSSYNGWLISDNFFKRAFAIWFHNVIINIIISLAVVVILLLLTSPFLTRSTRSDQDISVIPLEESVFSNETTEIVEVQETPQEETIGE
jgi:hypothetical protein